MALSGFRSGRVELRRGPVRRRLAVLGLSACSFAFAPSAIGYQDLVSLIAHHPSVAERGRAHVIASPFGTIHAATFSFRRPIGTATPMTGYTLASIGPDDGIGSSLMERLVGRPPAASEPAYPTVDRRLKGDRQPLPATAEGDEAAASTTSAAAAPDTSDPASDYTFSLPSAAEAEAAPPAEQVIEFDHTTVPMFDLPDADETEPDSSMWLLEDLSPAASAPSPMVKSAHLYFGPEPLGAGEGGLQPWQPGQAPQVAVSVAQPLAGAPAEIVVASASPDAMVLPATVVPVPVPVAKLAAVTHDDAGQTVASKGAVSGAEQAPKADEKSPAERLKLTGKARAQAEKCLANAVYFEARSEPVRGQIAVAQVVMNRVFSPFYPKTVCGVVYQNANRRLACQFTFACDGIRDVVSEPEAWERASRIAKDTLDGKLWLADVAKATHYHATYVRPYWVREMRKMQRLGLHTFYRPRRWGNGEEEPKWGDAAATIEAVKNL